jgi:hypothetical protein
MNRTVLGTLAAAVLAVGCATTGAHAATAPHGVFALTAMDTDAPATYFADASVAGITLDSSWAALEPVQGTYDWTALDTRVATAAAAGRQVALSVTPGVFSPAWVYAAGAARFTYKWTMSWGFTACSMVSFPLPWDPTYQAAWNQFVTALGKHYAGNAAVKVVKVSGINAQTAEMLLPYSVTGQAAPQYAVTCGNTPVAPLSSWKTAGYRPSKVAAAMQSFAATFAAAFPNQQLVLQTGPWGFPPIDNSGNVVANSTGDTTLSRTLLVNAFGSIGGHFALENDGLSDTWVWPRPAYLPASVPVAYQTASAVTNDASCRMNGFQSPCDPATVMKGTIAHANALPGEFLELYRADVLNPMLGGIIAEFR